jgi:hypothetical protein
MADGQRDDNGRELGLAAGLLRTKTMPIKNMWFDYRLDAIETFLAKAFDVDDKYVKALDNPDTEWEHDDAVDVLLGYQDIVFRAVYFELNALIELELKLLVLSIKNRGSTSRSPKASRGLGRKDIEEEIEKKYKIRLNDLPGFAEVDSIRDVANAYKHDDGFSGAYEEVFPGCGMLFGYRETRYELNAEKAHQSIQAVRKFMRALPGDRQQLPEDRFKKEDEAAIIARERAWAYLRRSGALGHQLGDPTLMADADFTAVCQLCGKVLQHDVQQFLPLLASMDSCPGAAEPSPPRIVAAACSNTSR